MAGPCRRHTVHNECIAEGNNLSNEKGNNMVTHIHAIAVEIRYGRSLYVNGQYTGITALETCVDRHTKLQWLSACDTTYCQGTLEDVVIKYAEERLGMHLSNAPALAHAG